MVVTELELRELVFHFKVIHPADIKIGGSPCPRSHFCIHKLLPTLLCKLADCGGTRPIDRIPVFVLHIAHSNVETSRTSLIASPACATARVLLRIQLCFPTLPSPKLNKRMIFF